MKKGIFLSLAIAFLPLVATAQPRPADKTASASVNLPAAFPARYESGIFGARKKQKGTLRFDDANERLVFYGENSKEMFSIPYGSFVVIYPDNKESMTQTGNVMSRMPLPGAGLFGLATSKASYLVINYDEQEVDAQGTANFRFDKKDQLVNFVDALGTKAKMIKRGDAYYRPKKKSVY
jgi:hypothetical protein